MPAERIAADGLVTFSYDIEPSFADADYAYISGIIVIAPFLLPGFRPC